MLIKPRSILAGIRSYSPFFGVRRYGAGATDDPYYCYQVWLGHLKMVSSLGLDVDFDTVAELGPGNSLGVGIAALLTGASSYIALDAVSYSQNENNLHVFESLVELISRRAPLGRDENSPVEFPKSILDDSRIEAAMSPDRLERIAKSIATNTDMVQYVAPWDAPDVVRSDEIDFVLSHAVMEHVCDINKSYKAMFDWVRPGGVVSHVIDFRCHGISNMWNAHWACGDMLWRVLKGNRPYFLNRAPLSEQISAFEKAGFLLKGVAPKKDGQGVSREQLAPRFRNMSDEDLETCGCHLVGVKNDPPP